MNPCMACGAPIAPHVGRGRPRKYCTSCSPTTDNAKAWRALARGSRRCRGCGAVLLRGPRERNPRKWCGDACRVRYQRGYRVRSRRCVWCNAEYASARSDQRFCTRRCGWLHRATLRPGAIPHQIKCLVCGSTFLSIYPQSRYCDDVCRRRARNWRYETRRPHRLQKRARRRILDRDEWRCYLCQRPIPRGVEWPHPLSGTIDHVMPVSAGGSDDPSNLRAAHWHCNQEKADRIPGTEFWVPAEAA